MEELLTIAEYSRYRNCSVAAVYKRLRSPSNNIQKYVVKQEGKTYLKISILADEQLFQEGLNGIKPGDSEVENEVENRYYTSLENNVAAVAIRSLEEQIKIKDTQIEELTKQLLAATEHEREMAGRLTVLLEQSNELQRNNQQLMARLTEPPKIIESSSSGEEEPELEPQPQPKKISWWKRIFG